MVTNDALLALAGVLVGALLGYWLSRAGKAADDRQQARGLLTALRADIERGTGRFKEFRRLENLGAPGWRLPTATWPAAVAFLAGIRVLSAEEITTFALFFDIAAELNYCLDRLANFDGVAYASLGEATARQAALTTERNRALLKVAHALDVEPPHALPLTARALAAANGALTRIA